MLTVLDYNSLYGIITSTHNQLFSLACSVSSQSVSSPVLWYGLPMMDVPPTISILQPQQLLTLDHSVYSKLPLKLELKLFLWPTVSRLVCLGIGHPYEIHNQICITVGHLLFSSCGAPSLIRVCNLVVQLLLAPSSAITLRSKSHTTHYHLT
jgi:hypothetical protein